MPKGHAVTVEMEIEVRQRLIDILAAMTVANRSLRAARELKSNWSEGQQRTEQAVNSPHPLTPEKGANPVADFPDARPVGRSLPRTLSAAGEKNRAQRSRQNTSRQGSRSCQRHRRVVLVC